MSVIGAVFYVLMWDYAGPGMIARWDAEEICRKADYYRSENPVIFKVTRTKNGLESVEVKCPAILLPK